MKKSGAQREAEKRERERWPPLFRELVRLRETGRPKGSTSSKVSEFRELLRRRVTIIMQAKEETKHKIWISQPRRTVKWIAEQLIREWPEYGEIKPGTLHNKIRLIERSAWGSARKKKIARPPP
jgi:hypothetical protein